MKKSDVIIIVLILIGLAIVIYTSLQIVSFSQYKTVEGTIHKIEKDWGGGYIETFWGIDEKGLLFDKKMRFAELPIYEGLPEEFQQEGLKVKIKYETTDVIGTDDWDIVINIIEIEKI